MTSALRRIPHTSCIHIMVLLYASSLLLKLLQTVAVNIILGRSASVGASYPGRLIIMMYASLLQQKLAIMSQRPILIIIIFGRLSLR